MKTIGINRSINWVDVTPDNKTFYSEVFEAEIFLKPILYRFILQKRTPNIFNNGMWDYRISNDIMIVSDNGSYEDITVDTENDTKLLNATSKDEAIGQANRHIEEYFKG